MRDGEPSVKKEVTLADAISKITAFVATEQEEDTLEGLADFGSYDGLPPKIILLDDGRKAKLIEPISYHQRDGTQWPVPADANLDGASIPRPLWSIIGGPFEGKYRNASIVHDRYCDTEERSWQDTHRMFYDAMRCSGVDSVKARVMFYAVYRFGPRWEVELEGVSKAQNADTLSDRTAATLLYDAEAIAEHGLEVNEIEALADARNATVGDKTLEGTFGSSDSAADALVVAGGSATAEDVAVVATGARNLPSYIVTRFLEKKIRILACRENVTDFERDLDGVIPRGWERTGRTWNTVPGAYFPGRKRVVVSTIAGPDGGRVIPGKQTRLHGSDDLLLHEAMHGYDFACDHLSRNDGAYAAARDADLAGLSHYEQQAGTAGLEETFAETGAQHCLAPGTLASRAPRLAAFWQAMPAETESVLAEPLDAPESPVPLGLATLEADGRIVLDLRATDDGGAIGHAMIELAPGSPEHADLEQELFLADDLESMTDERGRRTAPFYG